MAKKKPTVRELREQQKLQKAEGYRAQDLAKKEEEERKKAEQAAQEEQKRLETQRRRDAESLQGLVDKVEAKRLIKKSPKVGRVKTFKSAASAVGVKSTFVIQKRIIRMTSAGPVHEKEIKETEVTTLAEVPVYGAHVNEGEKQERRIHVQNAKNPGLKANIDNPLYSSVDVGEDQIGLRSMLEKEFFGQTFPDDNVHIQIIYNILDTYKILTVYSNNIVYSLNNLRRHNEEGGELDDMIADMSLAETYEKISAAREGDIRNHRIKTHLEEFAALPQLSYYGSAFTPCCSVPRRSASDAEKERYQTERKKHIYYVLALLGQLRQWCTHSREAASLFVVDRDQSGAYRAIRNMLDSYYSRCIDKLNSDFMELNGKTNLPILFSAYAATNDEQKKQMVRRFYDFNVRKAYKNMGFSIKRLRECMLSLPEVEQYTGQEYDSVRSKLYMMMDFVLHELYTEHTERTQALVEELRAVVGEDPDVQKTTIYCREAKMAWADTKDMIRKLAEEIGKLRKNEDQDQNAHKSSRGSDRIPEDAEEEKKAAQKEIAETKAFAEKALEGYKIEANASYFSKTLYLVTRFLDGKEINDLLTNLANKLESIGELLVCLREMGLKVDFAEKYSLFSRSAELAEEIRLINSFARMTKPDEKARLVMFREAAEILGFDDQTDEALLTEMLNKNIDENTPRELIKFNSKKGRYEKKMNFRNFIVSNVIKSDRFRYLIRYGSPKYLREIANNQAVIRFVLADMPDTQIDRYYESCKLNATTTREAKMDALASIITGIHFHDFERVDQEAKVARNTEAAQDKAKKQAVISLYLNVLYQLVKNLMYVNARYVMALRALENDTYLVLKESIADSRACGDEARRITCRLTERMIQRRREEADRRWPLTEHLRYSRMCKRRHMLHPCEYLEQDMASTEDGIRALFRNQVVHVAAVRNAHLYIDDIQRFDSYYGIYHYLIQRSIRARYESIPTDSRDHFDLDAESRTRDYFDLVERHRTDCRDFTKALCAPFGYNLPRFKNLTIGDLFDRNRPPLEEESEG